MSEATAAHQAPHAARPSGSNTVGPHKDMASAIRVLAMDAVEHAKSGHPGMPMGMADVATVLFGQFLRFDPHHPHWPDRDRFVLSAGHGSMLIYAINYLTGYPDMGIDQIKAFRQLGSATPGHPEYGHTLGVETTTGPLGQGLANAVGMAIAERKLNARYGDAICNHHTYVIAGDGCLMEGISHEAISLAGHLKLGRLIVIFDDNAISIDGPTNLAVSDDQLARFAACGWHVARVDGHDPEAIALALHNARAVTDQPSLIAARTIIGYGAPKKQGTASTHGSPLGADEIAATRAALGWTAPAFEIPADILAAWRAVPDRNAAEVARWKAAAARLSEDEQAALTEPLTPQAEVARDQAIAAAIAGFRENPKALATRQTSQMTLEHLVPAMPALLGGSADLTGSNGTMIKAHRALKAGNYDGDYIHYGVREHAMAAAMNGIALHGGLIPYGGTFLVFTDYCRPSIRLSALMGQRVVYVMTHDSIALGEDGPTHQPIEHLAALRAIPNLLVLRPADAVETAECWQIALSGPARPVILALTRQALPLLREAPDSENRSSLGAYVLFEPSPPRAVTLIGTGSEVALAMEVRKQLANEGIHAAVVSMPSWELFDEQPAGYREAVLGTAPRLAIEAGVKLGWERYIGANGGFIGLNDFGASAPMAALFEHFGLVPQAITISARSLVAGTI